MILARVPICPQWNLTNGCVCTPDGGFLYVGSRSINYVSPIIGRNKSDDVAPPLIKVFHTRQTIHSVDVDPGWPTDANENELTALPANGVDASGATVSQGGQKYFAVLAQDNSVQIWDFDRGCAVSGHKAHFSTTLYMEGNGPQPQGDHVLLSYMRNRNVLSMNAQELVVYCIASNTYCRRPTFVAARNQTLTVLRCSPYNEHIFAVGTSRGLIVVGDLQRMCNVYTLRGHDAAITSLSWCPMNEAPIERGTQKPAEVKPHKVSLPSAESDDIFDIYDYDYLENEFGVPSDKTTRTEADEQQYAGTEKIVEFMPTTNFDFAEACQSLQMEISALKQDDDERMPDVTLADCQQVPREADLSSSCKSGSNESTEGSLDIGERSSSDDDVGVDGTERKPKQQILHQAEVHAEQCLELEKKETGSKVNISDDTIKAATDSANVGEKEEELPSGSMAQSPREKKGDAKKKEIPRVSLDILLASASVDGNFWIWNTQTGAGCDSMRPHSGAKHGKNTSIEVVWLSSTQFLTSNKSGELAFWSLVPESGAEGQQQRYKFKEDKKQNFQQRSVVAFSVARNDSLLWCVSSHREISCENLKTKEVLLKYSCASTNVSAMRECPDDMNKIALGFSDRRIGIIDISKMSPTTVYIDNFTSRIDSPVLSLAWSPDSECLAFGTLEGRVGIINVANTKYPTITFNPICGKPVYSIDWQHNQIFTVCNDILAVYAANAESKDAHIIREVQSISSISVRHEKLFVGTQRGHLQVYCRNPDSRYSYKLFQDITLAPRYITEIAWSPIASDLLAVVANANNIHILKLNTQDGSVTPLQKIEVKNQKAANACVKWSNHKPNELLTCGFDGGVRVWNINSGTNDEKFLKQFHCPMTCGLFLPTDENIIMCAGKSTSVELIDMRRETSMVYSAAKWKRSNTHTLDYVKWALKVATRTEAKQLTVAEKRRVKQAAAGATASAEVADTNVSTNGGNAEVVAEMISSLKLNECEQQPGEKCVSEENVPNKVEKCASSSAFMRNPTTLLYLTTKELNKDVLTKLSAAVNGIADKNLVCAKLFGTKLQAKELLAAELKNHKNSEQAGISSIFMPQLNASIKDEILQCIQQKQLNEWHVSLAPTISYNFWQKCCQAFADQLLEQGYALQAATYMIALHRQVEAIDMLTAKNYFKEALLIARIYLQRDDPLQSNIIDKWITHLDMNGNLAGAALLCVLWGQMQRAYETLAKVRNIHPDIERVLEIIKTKQNIR